MPDRSAASAARVVVAAGAAAAAVATGMRIRRRLETPAVIQAATLVGVLAGVVPRLAGRSLAASGMQARAGLACAEEASDPSLFIVTNVDMGEAKKTFMLSASKAVASSLSKPESYVAVHVQDKQDVIWGGSDEPCALCKVFSLGSINLANNKKLTEEVSKLLADFDIPANRIYINFFDIPRENCGYNGATFAG